MKPTEEMLNQDEQDIPAPPPPPPLGVVQARNAYGMLDLEALNERRAALRPAPVLERRDVNPVEPIMAELMNAMMMRRAAIVERGDWDEDGNDDWDEDAPLLQPTIAEQNEQIELQRKQDAVTLEKIAMLLHQGWRQEDVLSTLPSEVIDLIALLSSESSMLTPAEKREIIRNFRDRLESIRASLATPQPIPEPPPPPPIEAPLQLATANQNIGEEIASSFARRLAQSMQAVLTPPTKQPEEDSNSLTICK